jgi:hypothetical protein
MMFVLDDEEQVVNAIYESPLSRPTTCAMLLRGKARLAYVGYRDYLYSKSCECELCSELCQYVTQQSALLPRYPISDV